MTDRGIRVGVRRLFHLSLRTPSRIHADADEELAAFVEARIDDLVAQGLSPEVARAEALRLLGGNMDDARARLHHSARQRERRIHTRERLENIAQDVKYAWRGLRRSPSFTLAVVLTLGLGIGANVAMFTIVDRLLFRTPAYLIAPARVHRLYFARTSADGVEFDNNYTQFNRYRDLARSSRTIELAVAYASSDVLVGRGEDARQLPVGAATASLWQMFSVQPVIGRFFTAGEAAPRTGSPVAVLSYSAWRSRFGGSPDVLGRSLAIGAATYTIIGVAPPEFTVLDAAEPFAIVPLGPFGDADKVRPPYRYDVDYTATWLEMYVRLRPGVTTRAATTDLTYDVVSSYTGEMTAAGMNAADFLRRVRPRVVVGSALFDRGPRAGNEAKISAWVLGVTVVVLLVACANIGNLLLTRALRRRHELSVRVALGASRTRLVTQLLTESVVLALLGGAAGVAIARLAGGVFQLILVPGVAVAHPIDLRVLAFAVSVALAVGLAAGIAPALYAIRTDIAGMLKSDQRSGTEHSAVLRQSLVVAQVSLAALLLLGAGLFVRSLRNVASTHLGFDADRLLRVEVETRGATLDTAALVALREWLVERARALPVVEDATPAITVPFAGEAVVPLFVPGVDSLDHLGEFVLQTAAPNYFATMGTRLIRGRGFTDDDRHGSALVLIVSQTMARKVWPAEGAIGQCVRLGADTAPCRTVIGVAEDVKHGRFDDEAPMLYYVPIAQTLHGQGWIFVRTRPAAAAETEMVRRALQQTMPAPMSVIVTPVAASIYDAEHAWRLGATMFSVFGVLCLVVAAIGLYGTIAYAVAQRAREVAVRVALGASTPAVVRLVVRQCVSVTLLGTALGCGGALLGGRWLAPLLFGESARDPVVFGVAAASLIVVALAAALVPARRAARLDPASALRLD